MKIGFICNEYPPAPGGGIGTTTQTLVKEFLQRGHDVVILGYNLNSTAFPIKAQYYPLDQPIWPLHKRHALAIRAKEIAFSGKVDVWIGFDYQGYYLYKMPVPFVVVLEGSDTFFARELGYRYSPISYFFDYLCLRQASQWIAPSCYVQSSIKTYFRLQRPSVVIPNPINTKVFAPVDNANNESENLILFVGSVMRKKGILEIIQAANLLFPQYPQLRFRFVGRIVDSLDQKARAMLHDGGGKEFLDRLNFVGTLPYEQIPKEMNKAKCCVMPSYMETFGNVWAEAMACEKPVIGSLRGPGPEIIEHGRTGLLVDPESPEDIASKIELLLTDNGLARRLGVAARQSVCERFDVTTVTDSYVTLLKDAVAS